MEKFDRAKDIESDSEPLIIGKLSKRSLVDMLFNMTLAMGITIALVWALHHFFPDTVTVTISVVVTVLFVWALVDGIVRKYFLNGAHGATF